MNKIKLFTYSTLDAFFEYALNDNTCVQSFESRVFTHMLSNNIHAFQFFKLLFAIKGKYKNEQKKRKSVYHLFLLRFFSVCL